MRTLLVLLLCVALCAGCAGTSASLRGYDVLDQGVQEIQVGLEEYHADDVKRVLVARNVLIGAFATDLVAAGGEAKAIAAQTTKFIGLLDKLEASKKVEATRYENLIGTLKAMMETTDQLRQLSQLRLGWETEAVHYAESLRQRLLEK